MFQNCLGHLPFILFSILTVGYLQLSLKKLIQNFHFVPILEMLDYIGKRYWSSAMWKLQDMSCAFFFFYKKVIIYNSKEKLAELQLFKSRLRQKIFARLYK